MNGRLLSALLLAAALCVSMSASAQRTTRMIDLNAPGALSDLRAHNPGHFDKIRKILEQVQKQPSAEVPKWLQTNFDAHDDAFNDLILTSYPGKKRLDFALEKTRYTAVITLTEQQYKAIPAN
jgi:hypothetical protein